MTPEDAIDRVRVVIVDNYFWMRTGRATALGKIAPFEVVAALTPQACESASVDWSNVEIVLVNAHDPNAAFDRFVGVKVVRQLRRERPGTWPVIVAIAGHADNDLLRRRMAEAGADLLCDESEVATVTALVDLLLDACRRRRNPLHANDVGRRQPLNEAIEWAGEYLGEQALMRESQKALPISRRRIISARQRLGPLMGQQHVTNPPTWRSVAEFLNRARGVESGRT